MQYKLPELPSRLTDFMAVLDEHVAGNWKGFHVCLANRLVVSDYYSRITYGLAATKPHGEIVVVGSSYKKLAEIALEINERILRAAEVEKVMMEEFGIKF